MVKQRRNLAPRHTSLLSGGHLPSTTPFLNPCHLSGKHRCSPSYLLPVVATKFAVRFQPSVIRRSRVGVQLTTSDYDRLRASLWHNGTRWCLFLFLPFTCPTYHNKFKRAGSSRRPQCLPNPVPNGSASALMQIADAAGFGSFSFGAFSFVLLPSRFISYAKVLSGDSPHTFPYEGLRREWK